MVTSRVTGVLALQGGYARHIDVLRKLGAEAREVRTRQDLAGCDSLIIPGGESTVFTKFITNADGTPNDLHSDLRSFALTRPVMGTCAGLILLSKNCGDNRVAPLGVLPVTVARNGWGRQTESFIEKLDLNPEAGFKKNTAPFEAVFIRAPRILSIGPEVRILASVSGRNGAAEPVMVAWKNILGLTFHPELAVDDARIHEWFLSGF